jgi:hypothetical protein
MVQYHLCGNEVKEHNAIGCPIARTSWATPTVLCLYHVCHMKFIKQLRANKPNPNAQLQIAGINALHQFV